LKLDKLIAVKAVYPSCQIVHLICIDAVVFKYAKSRYISAYLRNIPIFYVIILKNNKEKTSFLQGSIKSG